MRSGCLPESLAPLDESVSASSHLCGLLVPPPPGRNTASRGGQSAGPAAAFNRSTEDLRARQQPGGYGRLREWALVGKGRR